MPLKTHADEQPSLNMTPMIDVVFLLIIFFMAGTKFAELERKIGLNVPEVADAGALSDAPAEKVVNVYHDGAITLDREQVTLEELTGRLAQARSQYEDLSVVVRGDGKTDYQTVAEVFNACKQAGINSLGMSVRIARETTSQH